MTGSSNGQVTLSILGWALPALVVATASLASAQSIVITVRDSATSRPLPGVIVSVLGDRDTVLVRRLTGEAGLIRIGAIEKARAVRATRIGFSYAIRRFPAGQFPETIDIVMAAHPMLLDPVVVHQRAKCSPRNDRQAAFSLLEHARSGLLASIIAQAAPSKIVALRYRRWMAGSSDSITSQEVARDSAGAMTSFSASLTAADFVRSGFVSKGPDGPIYHGPDAAVLLDDAITTGYCFHIAEPARARPGQVGLAFARPDRHDGRIDVNGVLWIDTVRRALSDIEFRYVGFDYRLNFIRPGGAIHFSEVRAGVSMIDRWHIRVPAADTSAAPRFSAFDTGIRAAELGGEMARAEWADGEAWFGKLGYLVLRAVNPDSTPAIGKWIALENTDYRARADSQGMARFRELLPGPYRVSVADARLDGLRFTIPTDATVQIVRDSTTAGLAGALTLEDYVERRCAEEKRLSLVDTERLLMRVIPARPLTALSGISVSLTDSSSGRELRDSFITRADGIVTLCRNLQKGTTLLVRLSRRGSPTLTYTVTIGPALTIVPLPWP